ncbi:MAG: rod shape-determining protein RodA [bacterium]
MRLKIPFANTIREYYKHMNPVLLVCTLLLMIVGAAAVYSATGTSGNPFFEKQLVWYVVGIIVMLTFANTNYNSLINLSNYFYAFFMVLLLCVLFFGHTSLGATRWLKLGTFQFQPSEFMKIVVPLVMIRFLLISTRDSFSWTNILKLIFLVAVPIGFIFKQPDLGTSLLLLPIIFVVLFMGNIPRNKLLIMILALVLIAPVGYMFLHDYQKQRIQVFINPQSDALGSGYNVIQSQIAVGSGKLIGKGWAQGTQSQLNFIPIKYTDFIFAVIAEEFGLVGSLLVLLIYYFVIMEGLKIVKLCRFNAGKMLGSALTGVLFLQIFINIGMNIGIMPVTGITLPLLSYGGSSVIVVMMILGILQNIHREYIKVEE